MPKLSKISENSSQAMSIKYNTMVYELKYSGMDVLVMSLGEAFFDIPLFDMKDLPFPDIYHYSHSKGLPELRKKLSEYFESQYKFKFNPDNEIIVTAGSKIAIHMSLMAIVNPGDEIIYFEPAWVSYPEEIKLCYGIPVGVPYTDNVYQIEKYITPRTKGIIINTPNNPTGYIYTKKELKYLLELANKYDFWILSDEAYSDFELNNEFVSLGSIDKDKTHSIIFNSISKNYGISGWRMGYVISNKKTIYNILKINQHLITCPPTILEYYIAKYFYDILEITKPQIRKVVEERNKLAEHMDKIGLKYLKGNATFYFFVSIEPSKLGSEEFCTRLLQENHISTVPGLGYGNSCDKFIRASVGTASFEENVRGLNMVKQLIEETK